MISVPVKHDSFQLFGGLDLVSPTIALKPGMARDALNFESSISGGNSRIDGYERTDGRVGTPRKATFSTFTLTTAAAITVGGAVNNGAGATGTVIAIVGNTVHYTQQVGAFGVGNTINAGPTITVVGGTVTAATRQDYTLLAANVYRALIAAVPGSGPVRGVVNYNNVDYAWRDNVGPTRLEMYRATTAGWVLIVYGFEVSFKDGSVAPALGATITQGIVSAVVRRISLESGTWAGTAVGRFITDAPTGGAFIAGALTAGATANLNTGLTGGLVQALITFSPGGRVQTSTGAVGGSSQVYGCDNVNRGFEFDGTTMVPLKTGMVSDKPENVIVHKNYLFFTFGASLQNSAIAMPYAWTPLLGAGELLLTETITALQIMPGNQGTGAMAVYTKSTSSILYGTSFGSGGNSSLVSFNSGVGAEKYTSQNMDQPYALSLLGIVALQQSNAFGNFLASTLTLNIRPFIQVRRGRAVASGVSRDKSQYRVFYNDGSALYLTSYNGKFIGVMPVQYAHVVSCWAEDSSTGASNRGLFGTTTGFVMRSDVGNNFDGQKVPFSLELNYNSMGNQRVIKRFRKAAAEIYALDLVGFSFGYGIGYGDATAREQPNYSNASTDIPVAAMWDSFTWDAFVWDGQNLGPIELGLSGSAENISLKIKGSTATQPPFTINAMTIHYTPRRSIR